MKKLSSFSFICVLVTGLLFSSVQLQAASDCVVQSDGTVICEQQIPEGCFLDQKTNEIKCPDELNDGHCVDCIPRK